MAALAPPSAQRVGEQFVEQYYRILHSSPELLHRFYTAHDSCFSHGEEGDPCETVKGQKAIRDKLASLNLKDCRTEIKQVDSQVTSNGILLQVVGWLSVDNNAMRKFCQTFLLVQQEQLVYHIQNDLFRFLCEAPLVTAPSAAAPPPVQPVAAQPKPTPTAAPEPVQPAAPEPVVAPEPVAPTPAPAAAPASTDAPATTPPAAAPPAKAAAPAPPKQAPAKAAPAPSASMSWAQHAARPQAVPAQPARAAVPPAAQEAQQPKAEAAANGSAGSAGSADSAERVKPLKNGCSLFVKNLPDETSIEEVRELFSQIGPIREGKQGVTILQQKMPSKATGSKGFYSFVEFKDPASLKKCLSEEMRDSFKLRGQQLLVNERVNRSVRHNNNNNNGTAPTRGGRGGSRGGSRNESRGNRGGRRDGFREARGKRS